MALKLPAIFEGNLVADPETRTSSRTNKEFVVFKVMVTERVRDAEGNYADGESTAIDVQVHNERMGQHILNSVKKGDRVAVNGTYTSSPYVKDGEPGINHILMADGVHASLRFNDVTLPERKPTASASASAEASYEPWADVEVANVHGATPTLS